MDDAAIYHYHIMVREADQTDHPTKLTELGDRQQDSTSAR